MTIHGEALYSYLLQDLSVACPGFDISSGPEWPGITPKERQCTALATSLLKKYKDVKETDADKRALEKFLASNIRCKDWELRLETSGDEEMFGQFKYELYKFFSSKGESIVSNVNQISDLGSVGPGASLLANGNDFYTKLFSSPLSCTSQGLWTIYQHCVCNNHIWSRAEARRFSSYGDATLVAGNRLSFVDKSADVSRTICTEPSLNMFFQLGLGELMASRLRYRYGIDIQNQQLFNRELARVGSIGGGLCTIDLSSASDTVSLRMLEETLPKDILQWLRLFRSPVCTLPDGSVEELHMVSSMGNGFTFPLETIVFACAVSAVYRTLGIRMRRTKCHWNYSRSQAIHRLHLQRRYGHAMPHDPSQVVWRHGNYGVYGDDIVVTKSAAVRLVRLLDLLGFQVNTEKSFFEGPFRESCGADYFDGQPVRGVYIKSLRSLASRYVAINRLNEWSAVTKVSLPRTIQYLCSHVRKIYVPLHENDDAGIKIPSSMAYACGCETVGYRPWNNGPIFGSVQYKAWSAVPKQLWVTADGQGIKGPGRRRILNDDGLYLAYLRGDVINGRMGVRTSHPKYRTKRCMTPYWDHVPAIGKQFPVDTKALAKAIHINIFSV